MVLAARAAGRGLRLLAGSPARSLAPRASAAAAATPTTTLPRAEPWLAAAAAAPARLFGGTAAALKKRHIAAASNSPARRRHGNARGGAAAADDEDEDDEEEEDDDDDEGPDSDGSASSTTAKLRSPSMRKWWLDVVDPLDNTQLEAFWQELGAFWQAEIHNALHGGHFNAENLGRRLVKVGARRDRPVPLRELAQIVPRSKTTISLLAHDVRHVKAIMSAVQSSPDFNQQPMRNPDNELELLLRVELERGQDRVRRIRALYKRWLKELRLARGQMEKRLKAAMRDGDVLPDVYKRGRAAQQKLQNQHVKRITAEEFQFVKKYETRDDD